MGNEVILNVEERKIGTKGELNQLRINGFVPGVLYGPENDTISILVNARELFLGLNTDMGDNVVFSLKMKGTKDFKTAILKAKQIDLISRETIHVDFQIISLKEAIEVDIPFEITGESKGVTNGGILEHILHDVKIKCLPTNIPAAINIDVSELDIGNSIHIKDVSFPENVEVLTDPEQIVVSITAPKVEEKPEEKEPQEELKEPELIEKGKKEEQEEQKQ